MHLYFIRHGETPCSHSGRHTGLIYFPLTKEGEREARQLYVLPQAVKFRYVLASPLQRARRTSELAGFGRTVKIEPKRLE